MSKGLRILLIAALLAAGAYTYIKYRVPPNLEFDGIQAHDMRGMAFSPAKEARALYVFQFFATWCIDCRRELPIWQAMQPFMSRENIGLYLLSDEDATVLQPFTNNTGGIPLFKLDKAFKKYGVHTLPTVLVFNTKGEKVFAKSGNWEPDSTTLRTLISPKN